MARSQGRRLKAARNSGDRGSTSRSLREAADIAMSGDWDDDTFGDDGFVERPRRVQKPKAPKIFVPKRPEQIIYVRGFSEGRQLAFDRSMSGGIKLGL